MSGSVFDLLLDLDLLHAVELLLVRLEGLRQDGILSGGRSAVEIFLHCLVQAQAVLHDLLLACVEMVFLLLFVRQFLREKRLVF